MLRKNHGKSHQELWGIAERVLYHCRSHHAAPSKYQKQLSEPSQDDVKIAIDSGMVDFDQDGSVPTDEFMFWDKRADDNGWAA